MLDVHTKHAAPAHDEKEPTEQFFQNLLVAYDSSEASKAALQYAMAFAQTFNSLVTVVFVQPPSDFAVAIEGGFSRMKESYRQIADELELVAQNLSAQGIRNRVMQRTGTVADVLVQLAAADQADLLFLGAFGHKKDLPRLGSTAEYMLRSMPCAVLTVGPNVIFTRRDVPTVRMLLYASSLPARTGRAGEFVKALAQTYEAQVEIIHGVFSPRGAQDHQLYTAKVAADAEAAEKIRQRLEADGIHTTWRFVSSLDSQGIVERSREIHADLIVFGIEHHHMNPTVMGMISATIQEAECPVLTIPGPA